MSHEKRYPKKGEHGSAAGRCQWCGKEDSHYWGMYCSRLCAAAGSFYAFTCALVFSVLLTIWAIVSLNPFGTFVFGTFSIIFLYYFQAGIRMRLNTR